jgi:hypothetical protein
MTEMELTESAAKKVGSFLDAEVETEGETYLVKKKRTLETHSKQADFTCTLELDISFEQIHDHGSALNKAEIFLLPEEFPAFTLALSEDTIPFPTHYQHWLVMNPGIVSVCMESTEPPEHFAERLAAALCVIEQ